ncbi:unnamed protein product [Tilletia caries]|uniref:Zinc finger PHD-type domain-containing protein n=1 Tax=Tilletia caries TaxID=13290 RepID=A0ABN7J8H8_9BASI|nr:unnamed protein product [Tilletia caries]CAD6959110.1 unnamed protein product [Tilletia caries]
MCRSVVEWFLCRRCAERPTHHRTRLVTCADHRRCGGSFIDHSIVATAPLCFECVEALRSSPSSSRGSER